MKATFFTLFLTLVSLTWASAQTPRVTATGKNVSIAYGQPSKKGRVVLGKVGSDGLDKYGKIWRTGANASTEITFKKDGQFGGKSVKAGTYSLFTIPGETEWEIILNGVLGQSGAYDYEKNKSKDVLKVMVPAKKYSTSAEKLTFTIKDASVDLQWDKEGFSVPVKF